MSHVDSSIAKLQAKAASQDGLAKHHKWTTGYLNERVLTYLGMATFIGLVILWMASPSPYIVYGSLVVVAVIAALLAILITKRDRQLRELQEQQAKEFKSQS